MCETKSRVKVTLASVVVSLPCCCCCCCTEHSNSSNKCKHSLLQLRVFRRLAQSFFFLCFLMMILFSASSSHSTSFNNTETSPSNWSVASRSLKTDAALRVNSEQSDHELDSASKLSSASLNCQASRGRYKKGDWLIWQGK